MVGGLSGRGGGEDVAGLGVVGDAGGEFDDGAGPVPVGAQSGAGVEADPEASVFVMGVVERELDGVGGAGQAEHDGGPDRGEDLAVVGDEGLTEAVGDLRDGRGAGGGVDEEEGLLGHRAAGGVGWRSYAVGVPHPSEHSSAGRPLSADEAVALAASLQAFATASRLRILWALLDGEKPVDELVEASGLSQSATSHQLRLLKDARLVSAARRGRQVIYRLHDHHLPDLLAAMRHHHEHVLTAEGEDTLVAPEAPADAALRG